MFSFRDVDGYGLLTAFQHISVLGKLTLLFDLTLKTQFRLEIKVALKTLLV